MKRTLPILGLFVAGIAAVGTQSAVQAQQAWPARPIRIVVPFAPGGSTDIVARALGARASEGLGQTVVIENRAGAGGNIGAEVAARAAPDGYTLFMGHVGTLAINPALYRKLPYDPIRDFSPITLAIASPLMLVVHPSLPAKSLKDVLALARKRPGQLTYASAGSGSASHLGGALLESIGKVDVLHVPYKGTGPATMAVVGGEVTMMFSGQGTSWPLVNAGKLHAIAHTGAKSIPNAPKLAAMNDALPGYEVINWHGVLAPAGTSAEIIRRLHAEFVKALGANEVRARFTEDGFQVVGNTPDEFARFIAAEKDKWAKVIAGAKIPQE
ncbi:MAG: tripartite tricarboxylate transporter substrate binding protein [Proteobacteria bacterium]|nr:tripartite tricarboxylate transporter substrate binding protein [Burkholderiales bacterium]